MILSISEKQCDHLVMVPHGTLLSTEVLFHYGDTVDLVCADGYHITGEAQTVTRKTRECIESQLWDFESITCSGICNLQCLDLWSSVVGCLIRD